MFFLLLLLITDISNYEYNYLNYIQRASNTTCGYLEEKKNTENVFGGVGWWLVVCVCHTLWQPPAQRPPLTVNRLIHCTHDGRGLKLFTLGFYTLQCRFLETFLGGVTLFKETVVKNLKSSHEVVKLDSRFF